MATSPFPLFSVQDYLKLEEEADYRSEYLQGEIVAMAAPTISHSLLAGETLGQIAGQLRGKPCSAMGSDARLRIAVHDVYTYPDIVVIYGRPNLEDGRKDTIIDATFIVEILSPSTRNYDRGEKFRYYRALPSFTEYLLLAQDSIRAEHHTKQPDGSWLFREYLDTATVIELRSIGCSLPLGELYARIEFPA